MENFCREFSGFRTVNGAPTTIFHKDRIHFIENSGRVFFTRGDSILEFNDGNIPTTTIGGGIVMEGYFNMIATLIGRMYGRKAKRVKDGILKGEQVYEFI